MNHRSLFFLLALTLLASPAVFGQCSTIEFDSRTNTATDPSYVEGVALLSPGSFVGVQISQQPAIDLLQVTPHMERQLINCYQKASLGTAAPAFKDYSAGAGSMPVNIGRLNSGWTIGAISLGFGDSPNVEVVAANAPLQITTQAGYSLPGDAITGLFVDLNKDGFADLVIVSSNEQTNAGAVSVLLGNGDGTFQTPVNYAAGSNAVSVAAGDFNGDGIIDLAVAAETGSANVLLLLGTGTGTFGAASPAATLPSNIFPTSIAAADVNGDGRLDLVLTAYAGLYILLGNGSGSFTLGPLIPLASPGNYTAVGDFNMDGKPDLAVASALNSTVSILIGDGAGNFASPVSYLGPTSASYLVVTDVNGDGKPDIAVAQGTPSLFAADDGSGSIATLIGNGDGTFQGSQFYSVGSDATDMISADVNGDGKPDLIVTSSVTSFGGSANQVTTTFRTFLNQGNGTFAAPLSGASTTLGTSLTAADFNGDGKMDLAIAGANVSVLFGKGDGTFLTGTNIPGVTSAGIVAAGDFNGDGKPDLIVGSTTSGFLQGPAGAAISLNTGNGTFAAPANLGGSTPIQITSGSPSAFNPSAIVTADFNRDGKLDFAAADGGAEFDASQPGGLIVFLGNGNGTFQNAIELPAGVNPSAIAVGDLNGDGIPDMAISTGGTLAATPSGYELAVLIGNGDGTFKPAVFYPTDFGPAGLAIADMNGDGKPDIILMQCCGDISPAYLLGNGDGTLQPETGFKAGASPFGVIAADLNNDGKPDLALISSFGVGILINHTPSGGFTSVSAAGFVDVPLTPNSIVSGFGAGLASGSQPAATIPLPTQLAGAGISIKDATGATTPAGLFYASPLQVNYLVPGNIAIGPAQLSSASSAGTLTESLQIVPFAPSLFLLYSGNLVAGYLTRVTNGVVTTEPVYETSGSGIAPRPIPLPTGSDQLVLTVFGTGLRDYQGTFYAMAGNQFAPVLYAGTQGGFLGLDQVNIQLPSTLPSGTLPIVVGTFTGGFSNTASILIQ